MENDGLRIKITSVILGSLCVIILIYAIMMGYTILTNYNNFVNSFSYPSYTKSWFDIRTYSGGAMIISVFVLAFLGTPLLFIGKKNTLNRVLLPSDANSSPIKYHKTKIFYICIVIDTLASILIGVLFMVFGPLLFQKSI